MEIPASMLKRSMGLALIVTVVAVLVLGKDQKSEPGADRPAWNVIFLTLDTTRADRLGAYGFAGAETPNIDRLAGEGTLFEQAESVAPLTLPAHCSLFTGRFPFQHGVHDNGALLELHSVDRAGDSRRADRAEVGLNERR